MNVELLTPDIYERFDGSPPPFTIRGVALTDGDDVLAILCISVVEGANFVICSIKEGATKRDLILGWHVFKEMMKPGKSYYALADESISTAPGFLKHFGFELHESNEGKSDIYIYRES